MNRFWSLLFDPRVLAVLGLSALAAFLFLGARELEVALIYAGLALGVALLVALVIWSVRRVRANRAAKRLQEAIEDDAEQATLTIRAEDRKPAEALRDRLLTAVKTIRTSRLGQLSGAAALYELPWYIVIGNPAAGKSSAVIKSGLNFPLAADGTRLESAVVQGIGGTRNCDWFMTSEGILLDTAGRYSVHEEDRAEWLGFLGLLKKHRPMAPINGVLVAVSVAELTQGKPEQAIQLAKRLRQRVQELTEKLEVFAPLYLVFTKADLIAGFAEFFEDFDRAERDRVWGATLPFAPDSGAAKDGGGERRIDAVAAFDRHFDELRDGLKEIALARMSLQRGQALPTGLLTFPLEFDAAKPALRAFVATLFEDNPYQFRPVFRGFYFTSAVQEGSASSRASEEVARRFALGARRERTTARVVAANGFFLKDLFQRVIFADKHLVRQYASRSKQRARMLTFAAAVGVLALALTGWSWTWLGNRQLLQDVQADLAQAARLQDGRVDLAARLEALELLQYRIEQLAGWQDKRPFGLGLGLYQGEAIERKLRQEYYAGLRQVLLQPVARAIEGYLGEVNAHADQLQPLTRPPESGARAVPAAFAAAAPVAAAAAPAVAAATSRYADASPTDVEDAYNALKTYLMLAERQRMEPGHLKDQIARFWRGWLERQRGNQPPEVFKRRAENVIGFAMAQLQDPAFPTLDNNFALVDVTRANLRRVMRGMPARERVYAEVKARASTRFAQITVANIVGEPGRNVIAGSVVVPGTFTREAWDGYIEKAFKDAANGELQSTDWVLQTAARDDLTLEGSPDQIRKSLTELYKTEYVREWQRFLQGIAIAEFPSFAVAVQQMNRLGDPASSPIKQVLTTLNDQTSWDNPSVINERAGQLQRGFIEWFKQSILRMAPSRVEVKVDVTGGNGAIPMGPIGREFAALHKLMAPRDGQASLLGDYLKALGALRTRFNEIGTQGDPGPAARKLMATTLEGGSSEFVGAVRLVEEQMLAGMTETARGSLRPLLLRPLMQGFAVLLTPAETELNRAWAAQVHEPFQRTLAGKYPFDAQSKVEAVPQEIAKLFGPGGAVAKFADESLGPLVLRRGDSIVARTWLDMGVRLKPEFGTQFAHWVAPLDGAAGGAAPAAAASPAAAQTSFQILPQGAPGLSEYSVEIDGQVLRYRNGAAVWTPFVWPNAAGTPGARITGVTVEGRTIELLNVPGRFGLQRMFETAQRRKLADGANELSWAQGSLSVTLHLRVISQPGAPAAAAATPAAGGGLRALKLPATIAGGDEAMPAAMPVALAASGPGRGTKAMQ
ncbi:type VI secretion system membrane subunit TssM [Aquincola sp. S2]|uniref:Type VI secretion system membrane subunit TssM n=1 Tax=Pseudaquabacterium terrae TaxID=2732868 RepID=A0ABX2EL96_9BURK|nr:type VI secretion system membrane subunit TssM [Aquabacterium terrae]NRF69450.1 type VI secretion system membrane subunit TssM [Aquabacterium terrae]